MPSAAPWPSHSARYRQHRRRADRPACAGSCRLQRQAAFHAVLAVADRQWRTLLEVEGICEGTVLEQPRGAGGFGYDPTVSWFRTWGLTFGREQPDQKRLAGAIAGRGLEALLPRMAMLFPLRPTLMPRIAPPVGCRLLASSVLGPGLPVRPPREPALGVGGRGQGR